MNKKNDNKPRKSLAGGKRPGAGRKLGSKSKFKAKYLRDNVSDADMLKIINKAKQLAISGDKDMIKLFVTHTFGVPAVKPIETDKTMFNILIDC